MFSSQMVLESLGAVRQVNFVCAPSQVANLNPWFTLLISDLAPRGISVPCLPPNASTFTLNLSLDSPSSLKQNQRNLLNNSCVVSPDPESLNPWRLDYSYIREKKEHMDGCVRRQTEHLSAPQTSATSPVPRRKCTPGPAHEVADI
ncbi:hypothetical protein ILYODFUR_017382 [Ilyodon furcidens]|uniref:Uncharacterized protein n=1 Tax=Ilyodon furcidens TaxID=33524 RepID=A0ABV0UV29_9TELE